MPRRESGRAAPFEALSIEGGQDRTGNECEREGDRDRKEHEKAEKEPGQDVESFSSESRRQKRERPRRESARNDERGLEETEGALKETGFRGARNGGDDEEVRSQVEEGHAAYEPERKRLFQQASRVGSRPPWKDDFYWCRGDPTPAALASRLAYGSRCARVDDFY